MTLQISIPEREELNGVVKTEFLYVFALKNFPWFPKKYSAQKVQEVLISSFWDHQLNWSDSLDFLHLSRGDSHCNNGILTHNINVPEREKSTGADKIMKLHSYLHCSSIFHNFSKSIHHAMMQEVSTRQPSSCMFIWMSSTLGGWLTNLVKQLHTPPSKGGWLT